MTATPMPRMAMGAQLQRLLASGLVQDAGEIALAAGLISAGQLAAGVDPETVAGSALLGAGLSFPARPAAAFLGRGVGRGIDAHNLRYGQPAEHLQKIYGGFTQMVPGTNANIRMHQLGDTINAPHGQVAVGRYRANQYAPDGSHYGHMEGDLGTIARTLGDNVAQSVVQLVAPGIVANADVPTDESAGQPRTVA